MAPPGIPAVKSIEGKPTAPVQVRTFDRSAGGVHLPQINNLPILGGLHSVDGIKTELPFKDNLAYQHFLNASLQTLPLMEQVGAIVSGGNSLVNLGGPNGANLTGPEGVFSPQGWDRAYVQNLGPFEAIAAKGTGLAREAKNAYQNETYGLNGGDLHLPFDINPKMTFIDHMIVGGNNYNDLLKNATGAFDMLRLAYGLGRERGGMILPLDITLIKSFPVPLGDKNGNPVKDQNGDQVFSNMAGWNYFTNIGIFKEKGKMLRIARFVERRTESKIIKWAAKSFIDNTEKGRSSSRLVRWLVGRTFMKMHKPSIYTYLGDSFRIGNTYRQMVSNGFRFIENGLVEQRLVSAKQMEEAREKAKVERGTALASIDNHVIKEYMDRLLVQLYAFFGGIEIPERTVHDLRTEAGRCAYLVDIRAVNPEKTGQIAGRIIKEIASQLGIIHGISGNGGGHLNMHALGKVELALTEKNGNRIIYAVLELQTLEEMYNDPDKGKGYSLKIYADPARTIRLEDDHDLSNYKIVAIETGQHGEIERGAPGGGAVRPDNLGFGLRDLHSVDTLPGFMFGIIGRYPKIINNLEIEDHIFHLHAKIAQEADLNLLFAKNLGEPIDGKERRVNGAIYQLNDVFGGGDEMLRELTALFWAEYQKWYGLSRNKYASNAYQNIDALKPIYMIKGSFRRHEAEEKFKRYLRRFTDPRPDAEDIIAA